MNRRNTLLSRRNQKVSATLSLLILGVVSVLSSSYHHFYFNMAPAKLQLRYRSNAARAVKTTIISELDAEKERKSAETIETAEPPTSVTSAFSEQPSSAAKPVATSNTIFSTNATLQTMHDNNASILSWSPLVAADLSDSKNRLVVLIASCPYLDFVDNLVESLKNLGVSNYVVVPLDPLAEEYAVALLSRRHVVTIPPFVPEFNAQRAAKFNTRAFKRITSIRPMVLNAFLQQGYTVFYNDIDVVWRGNILDMLDNHTDSDMVAMVDSHAVEQAMICSGYLYLRPTDATKEFLDYWQSLLDSDASKKNYKNDQEAIYDAYQEFQGKLKTKLYPSDNPFFPSGAIYDIWSPEQQSDAWLIHNNFIKGHDFKINRFLRWDLWKPSGKLDDMMWECEA